jgi:hypothetical protein
MSARTRYTASAVCGPQVNRGKEIGNDDTLDSL